MTFDQHTHNVLMISFANIVWLFYKILDTKLIKTLKSGVHTRICAQLTFDLIWVFFFWGGGGGGRGAFPDLTSIPILLKTYQGTLLHGCQNVHENANRLRLWMTYHYTDFQA